MRATSVDTVRLTCGTRLSLRVLSCGVVGRRGLRWRRRRLRRARLLASAKGRRGRRFLTSARSAFLLVARLSTRVGRCLCLLMCPHSSMQRECRALLDSDKLSHCTATQVRIMCLCSHFGLQGSVRHRPLSTLTQVDMGPKKETPQGKADRLQAKGDAIRAQADYVTACASIKNKPATLAAVKGFLQRRGEWDVVVRAKSKKYVNP